MRREIPSSKTEEDLKMEATAAETMMRELADQLRDVIQETDDVYIEKEPEDAFLDLAARLVLRLSRQQIEVVPALQHAHGTASKRIFDIFTTWLQMQPDRSYVTRIDEKSGNFEVLTVSPNGLQAFFQGTDVQDAYAQMAQVISFNGGEL